MHTWPGGSCPTKPRRSPVNRRQRSFTSLDSSSRFSARWPAGRPLDILCTHDIARRLLPDLPRCGVRALTGYFGRGRRSASQCRSRRGHSIRLARAGAPASRRRNFHLERARNGSPTIALRGSAGGAYGRCRGCAALIAGCAGRLSHASDEWRRPVRRKAASLRHRVNSYFRKQTGVPERTLEMLSQARGISFDVAPSALEAALIEPDEIKQHRPPQRRAHHREPRVMVRATESHRAQRTRRHSVRSDRFLRPECSMNLVRSPPLRVARSAPVAGVPTRSRSKQVTRGSARCTLSFRAKTSARTTDCCGSEHAYGEKVGETAMLMKTTPTKPGVD